MLPALACRLCWTAKRQATSPVRASLEYMFVVVWLAGVHRCGVCGLYKCVKVGRHGSVQHTCKYVKPPNRQNNYINLIIW
jgi:hypothetical protein